MKGLDGWYIGIVCYLPQNPQTLFVKRTVREELYEVFRGENVPKEKQDAKVARITELCGLREFLDRHPYDISGGEQQRTALAKVLLLNIDHVPGREMEALGIVKGTVVQSKNFGKDFMAGMKTLVGGEITGYTEMLVEARQIATKRMVDEANAMGADAIVNIRFGSSAVMQGAAEVIAYGTAVKLK